MMPPRRARGARTTARQIMIEDVLDGKRCLGCCIVVHHVERHEIDRGRAAARPC